MTFSRLARSQANFRIGAFRAPRLFVEDLGRFQVAIDLGKIAKVVEREGALRDPVCRPAEKPGLQRIGRCD